MPSNPYVSNEVANTPRWFTRLKKMFSTVSPINLLSTMTFLPSIHPPYTRSRLIIRTTMQVGMKICLGSRYRVKIAAFPPWPCPLAQPLAVNVGCYTRSHRV